MDNDLLIVIFVLVGLHVTTAVKMPKVKEKKRNENESRVKNLVWVDQFSQKYVIYYVETRDVRNSGIFEKTERGSSSGKTEAEEVR